MSKPTLGLDSGRKVWIDSSLAFVTDSTGNILKASHIALACFKMRTPHCFAWSIVLLFISDSSQIFCVAQAPKASEGVQKRLSLSPCRFQGSLCLAKCLVQLVPLLTQLLVIACKMGEPNFQLSPKRPEDGAAHPSAKTTKPLVASSASR